jgi:hypothetical protein
MFTSLVAELIVTDDPALIERLRTNELENRRIAAEQAAITREVERRGLFRDDGHRSVKAFLRANLNWSNSQATNTIKVAALLDTVTGAGNALLNGHIGTAQANELGRLRANPRVGDQLTNNTTDHIETTRANGTPMQPTGQRTQTNIIRARLPKRSVHPDARTALEYSLRDTGRIDAVYSKVVDGEYQLAA